MLIGGTVNHLKDRVWTERIAKFSCHEKGRRWVLKKVLSSRKCKLREKTSLWVWFAEKY